MGRGSWGSLILFDGFVTAGSYTGRKSPLRITSAGPD